MRCIDRLNPPPLAAEASLFHGLFACLLLPRKLRPAQRQSKLVAPKAPRSSVTRRSAGTAARDSRQARCPARAMAASIDAASMARRCQSPFQEPRMFSATRRPAGVAGWDGVPIAGATGATRVEAPRSAKRAR